MILLKKTDEDGFLGTEEEKTGNNNLIRGRNHTEGLAMSLTQLWMAERTESGVCSNQRTKPLWQPPAGVRLAVRECSLQPLPRSQGQLQKHRNECGIAMDNHESRPIHESRITQGVV